MPKTLELKDGKILPALPADRTDPILASGIRSEGDPPRRRHIAWWDHPQCTREFDGSVWSIYHVGEAPARS